MKIYTLASQNVIKTVLFKRYMSHLISSLLVFFAGIHKEMKKCNVKFKKNYLDFLYFTFLLVLISINNSFFSQCNWYSTTIACTNIAPTIVGSSISCTPPNSNGGRRNFVVNNMTAGCVYRISNCGSGFDTQMTIRDASGALVVGYNDDNGPACISSSSSIDLTCPSNGTYNIQLNRFPCSTANQLNGTITVTLISCPTTPPSCASTPTPADAATGVSVGTTLSWPVVSGATGYDVFFGASPTPPQVATNQAGTTYNPGALSATTNYYWRVVPINSIGSASGCTTWSFTSGLAGCLNVPNGLWPFETYTPVCNGTPESITTLGYTGEYSNVNLTSGTQYTFSSSVSTDYITISNSAGTAILASGTSPLTWTSNVTGTIRFNLHNNISCATEQVLRTRFIQCGTPLPPPSNDACAGAISLSCGTSGIAGSTLGAVSETAQGSPGVGNLSVWYSFVGDGQQTTISSTAVGTFDHQMVIYTGSSCSNFCIIGNQDVGFGGGTETFTFTTTSGQQYYVYIADWFTGSTTSGTFNISRSCSTPPAAPANNNCIDAQSITVQCPGATSISGTTLNATSESSIANPSCDNCGIINDVWYTFNSGPNTSVNLTVTLGTASWLGGEVYTTCGSLATGLTIGGNAGNCDFNLSTPSPTVISGLTTNTTYILRLYTNDTYDTPGTFSFTLTNSVNNPGAVSVPASICAGTATSITNVTAATGAPGSVNYYFYYRGGPSNVGWQMYDGPTTNTSSSLPSAVINTPGTWFIARNSDFGCGQTNNATTVDLQLIVNSSPTVSLNCPNFCAGTPIDITATPTPAGTYTYNWTALPGGVSDPGNSATVNTSTAGTYTVIATNTATNCASEATSCTIAVQNPPSINAISPP